MQGCREKVNGGKGKKREKQDEDSAGRKDARATQTNRSLSPTNICGLQLDLNRQVAFPYHISVTTHESIGCIFFSMEFVFYWLY